MQVQVKVRETVMRTKPHKSSQVIQLSVEQQNAISLLILGKSDREVAEEVGVTRETVSRWRNENVYFMSALNQERKALWKASRDRVWALVDKALSAIEKSVDEGDTKSAFAILRMVKFEVEPPTGITDPDQLLWQKASEEVGKIEYPPPPPKGGLAIDFEGDVEKLREQHGRISSRFLELKKDMK